MWSFPKAQEFRHIYIYSIVNVTPAAFIAPIPKIFVIKVAILQLELVKHQQRHNLLAYMMYICLILSLQCIVGRFSTVVIFGCFVSGRDLVAVFWSIFPVINAKQDQSGSSLLAEVSHDETNWNESRETSAGFRRVSYHACPRVSLTTSDVFVTCDTTQGTGLNLSATTSGCWIWARVQILNGPIRVKDETTLRAAIAMDPITSLWGKPKRRIFRQTFRSLRTFRLAKHTYLEWNLLGFMELLVLLRFGTFLFEEKVICGVTSGQRWMVWFPY